MNRQMRLFVSGWLVWLLSWEDVDALALVNKGWNLLEKSGKILPQGPLVSTVKTSWKFAWTQFMTELAPQSKDGSYQRPSYSFSVKEQKNIVDEPGRYHIYVGNPCPVSTHTYIHAYFILIHYKLSFGAIILTQVFVVLFSPYTCMYMMEWF